MFINGGKVLLSALFNVYHAFLSASAWAIIWLVGFFGSTILVEVNDPSPKKVTVTALALTAAVVSGHTAKLISYAVGCDTDFRHLFIHDKRRLNDIPQPFRFFSSVLFLMLGAYFLYKQLNIANTQKAIFDSQFIVHSFNFGLVILCIFLAQMVFSWPDSEPGEKTT